MTDFDSAYEVDEIVINGTVGIRVVNGKLDILNLTVGSDGKYTAGGDASSSIGREVGWDDYLSPSGLSLKGNSAPVVQSIGGHIYEIWDVGTTASFRCHPLHGLDKTVAMLTNIHWKAMSTNPNTTHKVQFDITWTRAASWAAATGTANVTFSLVDTPTGYNRNEIIQAIQAQGILTDIDEIVVVTVSRVTPSTGTSYSGLVAVELVAHHYYNDGRLTTGFTAPYTKS